LQCINFQQDVFTFKRCAHTHRPYYSAKSLSPYISKLSVVHQLAADFSAVGELSK